MKYYNFFLLTKRKRIKKWLISDKVEIENAQMRVIKWKIVWNDNRKDKNWGREREREIDDICYNYELSC